MGKIGRYIVRKALQALPALVVIASLNFALIHLAPGDAADVLAGEAGAATPEYMAQIRAQYGLDETIAVQYARYLSSVMRLDLGYSHRYQLSVAELLAQRIPVTLILMAGALGVAVTAGVILGAVAARYADGVVDWSISALCLLAYSVPGFWLALMMIVTFSITLDWLPTGGFETIGVASRGLVARGLDIAVHMIMPVLALAAFYLAVYARLMRASMLEVSQLDFVRTAEAKGASEMAITFHHVLRNALLPVVTMAGLHIASLVGGAVVIEQVFALPGLGSLAFGAIFQRDYNLLLGILLVSSWLVIAVNIAVDVAYTFVDPRIELS